MTEEQKNWFDKLAEFRKIFAKNSQHPDYRGMWEVLIKGIYSEDAHFIYELLQNAEDVKATTVKLILKSDGLYFIHNGTISFTITDIDNPNENGHINAITAVGRTGKKISETIGKFGIGFKAVFQYTKTPHIYDPNFQFKIRNYIVPELLGIPIMDIEYDKENNTVFYFPFIREEEQTDNNKVKSQVEAYKDISEKLKDLDKPTLFLSNLKEITWQIGEESNTYKKEINETQINEYIKYERIRLSPDNAEFLVFTRSYEENVKGIVLEYKYSVGFMLEEKKLRPIEDSCAYCFFPTQQKTNINFLFHAPFLLNSNREAIPENQNLRLKDDNNNEHTVKENFNEILINQLAQLAADSLLILKELNLIDDNIIKIIPYKELETGNFFAPFYEAIKNAFETEELLPAKNKYAKKENSYWSSVQKLNQLFSNEQLGQIIGDDNAKWVFTTKGRDETNRGNDELADYIEEITIDWLDEKDLLDRITNTFIVKQDKKWLIKFYEWLAETEHRKSIAKAKPFFLNKEGKAVTVLNQNGKLNLYFPDNDGDGYETLNEELYRLGKKELFTKFGIREHTVKDEIENTITKFKNAELASDKFFAKAFKYFKNECPQDEIDTFIEKNENLAFIPCYSQEKGDEYYVIGGRYCYYPTEKLVESYKENPSTWFANVEELKILYPNDHKTLNDFLKKLGVNDKDPDLKDRVYKIAIPALQKGGQLPHSHTLKYFFSITENYEMKMFLNLLKILRI